jgi:hypothetical protein
MVQVKELVTYMVEIWVDAIAIWWGIFNLDDWCHSCCLKATSRLNRESFTMAYT